MTLIKFKQPVIAGNQFDRMPYFSEMVNDFLHGWIAPELTKTTVPAVNIMENDKSFEIQLAAPGMAKEDFKIEVENEVLIISAEKKTEQEEKTDRYTRKEFGYTSFSRSFNIPEVLESENIKAIYENGILCLTLPKKQEVVTKAVKEIKVS